MSDKQYVTVNLGMSGSRNIEVIGRTTARNILLKAEAASGMALLLSSGEAKETVWLHGPNGTEQLASTVVEVDPGSTLVVNIKHDNA
jgi:hypothetical protein